MLCPDVSPYDKAACGKLEHVFTMPLLVLVVGVVLYFCPVNMSLYAVCLQFRPARDLKDTLLHEMIHAAMFLEGIRDHGDHGPMFQAYMNAINKCKAPDPQVCAVCLLHTYIIKSWLRMLFATRAPCCILGSVLRIQSGSGGVHVQPFGLTKHL